MNHGIAHTTSNSWIACLSSIATPSPTPSAATLCICNRRAMDLIQSPGQRTTMAMITDGMSNTISIVETPDQAGRSMD